MGERSTCLTHDMNRLYKQGLIPYTNKVYPRTAPEDIAQRREQVAALAKKGLVQQQIAQETGARVNCISKDLRHLRRERKIDPLDAEQQRIKERRDKVADMYERGIKVYDIKNAFPTEQGAITSDLEALRKKGTITARIKKESTESIAKRCQDVWKLLNKGYVQAEIADKLKENVNKINKDLKFLRREGHIKGSLWRTARSGDVDAERKRVLWLHQKGKTPTQIVLCLKTSRSCVQRRIKEAEKCWENNKNHTRKKI